MPCLFKIEHYITKEIGLLDFKSQQYLDLKIKQVTLLESAGMQRQLGLKYINIFLNKKLQLKIFCRLRIKPALSPPLFNDLNDVISSNNNLFNYKKGLLPSFFSNTWI